MAVPDPVATPPAPRRSVWRNPWWIPPFLGSVPADVRPQHLSLLGAIALALVFEEYDLAMLTAALPYIAADLSMAEIDFGLYLGVIRLGALPALFFIPFADRIGRRRVFLAALVITALTTFLTGFSQTAEQFVALQMFTRTFFVTGSAVAFVVITEEFPAGNRGWGIGMLGALGACGHGLAMLLYSVSEYLPYGWRALYFIGVIPIFFLPMFRRRIHETERFTRHDADRAGSASETAIQRWAGPLVELARTHPARAVGIAAVGFLPSVGLISAFQFTGYFTQAIHGWSRAEYAAMVFLAGAIGIIGNVAAGHLGDRFGRRRVGFLLLGTFPLWVTVFYNGPGWSLPFMWIGLVFSSSGGRVILRALAAELFPTSQRASSSGLFAILDTLGAALGLFILYFGSVEPGDFIGMTSALAFAVFAGAALLVFFPETRRRELEAIS
ncbi:MAG: MFS transporter [Deltaproteobacteria bacterium]|nr:MAG: MFS transporter [Deltaproteobacteria bacterium]